VQDVTGPAVPVDSAWSGRWYLQKCTGVEGRGYSSITQGFSFNPSRVPVKRAHGNPLVPKLVDILASTTLFINDKIPPYRQGEK